MQPVPQRGDNRAEGAVTHRVDRGRERGRGKERKGLAANDHTGCIQSLIYWSVHNCGGVQIWEYNGAEIAIAPDSGGQRAGKKVAKFGGLRLNQPRERETLKEREKGREKEEEQQPQTLSGRWALIDVPGLPICFSSSDLCKEEKITSGVLYRAVIQQVWSFSLSTNIRGTVQETIRSVCETIHSTLPKCQGKWLRMRLSMNSWQSDVRTGFWFEGPAWVKKEKENNILTKGRDGVGETVWKLQGFDMGFMRIHQHSIVKLLLDWTFHLHK